MWKESYLKQVYLHGVQGDSTVLCNSFLCYIVKRGCRRMEDQTLRENPSRNSIELHRIGVSELWPIRHREHHSFMYCLRVLYTTAVELANCCKDHTACKT